MGAMKKRTSLWRTLSLAALVACAERSPGTDARAEERLNAARGLVIGQVYGGAGSRSASFNRDFVELFNRSATPVPLRGLDIHVGASSSEPAYALTLPEDAVVPPGGRYLVGFAAGEQGADVTVDAAGEPVDLLAEGIVALVARADGATERTIDQVHYGAFDASDVRAPSTGFARAVRRKGAGCTDTNADADDFESTPPEPRGASAPARPCDASSEREP
jgi:uncharacterized protein